MHSAEPEHGRNTYVESTVSSVQSNLGPRARRDGVSVELEPAPAERRLEEEDAILARQTRSCFIRWWNFVDPFQRIRRA
jgi:hypothetical protein